MELGQIELMRDASEVVRYDRENVRLYIREGRLSRYPDMRTPCHWHDDIEWIRVLEGEMRTILMANGLRWNRATRFSSTPAECTTATAFMGGTAALPVFSFIRPCSPEAAFCWNAKCVLCWNIRA